MGRFRVGYQIHPQHCTIDQIREAYRNAESVGADCTFVWDHMYPLYGDPDGVHYSSTPILAGMAIENQRAQFGALVTSVGYRNPEFYAYEVWTLNKASAPAGSPATTMSTGSSSGTRPIACGSLARRCPGSRSGFASLARRTETARSRSSSAAPARR